MYYNSLYSPLDPSIHLIDLCYSASCHTSGYVKSIMWRTEDLATCYLPLQYAYHIASSQHDVKRRSTLNLLLRLQPSNTSNFKGEVAATAQFVISIFTNGWQACLPAACLIITSFIYIIDVLDCCFANISSEGHLHSGLGI